MKSLIFLLATIAVSPTVSAAAPSGSENPLFNAFPPSRFDMGCALGWLVGSEFPTTRYDPVTNDRITYNLSRCTGGFISGVNLDTWKSWHADIRQDGEIFGTDIAGNSWRYDRKSSHYMNLTTGASCSASNIRHVCD